MKKKIIILAALLAVAVVQLSCSTKPVEEVLCWNSGGMWLCDDLICETGHCERAASGKEIEDDSQAEETFLSGDEMRCVQAGGIWLWDDYENLVGHCESLDFLDAYATAEPAEAAGAAAEEVPATEEPVEEDGEMMELEVGEPIDRCDARDKMMIFSYPLFDKLDVDGTRWCEARMEFHNVSSERLIFVKHFVIHDDRYPEDGPKWSYNEISPGSIREQQLGYHGFVNGGYNSWYMDRVVVVYPACFTDYKTYEIPIELLEPYAFDVPIHCPP